MELKVKVDKDSGHIHLPVYVNGQGPFDFALDTGAAMTTISKSLAGKLGIKTYEAKKRKATGVGGNLVDVMAAKADQLRIGAEEFQNREVAVIDFDSIFGRGRFAPGVIGHDILKDYVLSVNYHAREIAFDKAPRANLGRDNGIEWIDFRYAGDTHLVAVPVHINGEGPFELVLDTGSSGTVITPTLAKELGLAQSSPPCLEDQAVEEGRGCSEGVCPGVGGVAVGYGTTLKQLSVGRTAVENVMAAVIDLRVVSPKGEKIDYGILGYPFLKNYRLVIDYPRKRFALISEQKRSK